MTKVNLITPFDILHDDSYQMLVLYPSSETQKALQYDFLGNVDFNVNLYYYDKPNYQKEEVDWLLNCFNIAKTVIIDVDNVAPHIRDLLGYFISKSKTYWLTNSQDSVYNHISRNKTYTLDFLSNIGDNFEKE